MKKLIISLIYISFFTVIFSAKVAYGAEKLLIPVDKDKIIEPIMVNFDHPEDGDFPAQYKRVSRYKIDAINPTASSNRPGAYFPGYRGSGQLIIYRPKYGKYTYTNEYGKEATVRNGRVISFNGANSRIPADGYVISGHGKAKKWINENIIEGAYVKIDPDTMTIESVITPQSYLFKAQRLINEAKNIIIEYKKTLPNYQYARAQKYYDVSREKLEKAKYHITKENYKKALKDIYASLILAENSFYNAVPAVGNEFHGIWLRPVENNRSEIVKTLKKLKKTGIENIFLETFYQGYTIFPSSTMEKYGLSAQRQEFRGWDPLKTWIKEAHERDMKVHIWFQAFYAGNDDISKSPGHPLFVYPDWANVQRKNIGKDTPQPFKSEHNGYFFDPANHMVRRFLTDIITEIAASYNIDGLNIDYVRYPKSLSPNFPGYLNSTWGYTKYARDEFEKKYGKDPAGLSVNHSLWPKWIAYRQNKVDMFVSEVNSITKDKDILVSAVIFPDIRKTSVTKLQDWQKWVVNSYIDAVTPLIMSSDDYRAGKSVREIIKITGGNIKIYPGLFEPFTSGTPMNLLQQIIAVRKAGAGGIVIFDKAHLDEDFVKALRVRALKN